MGNRPIKKFRFNGDYLRYKIKKEGYSIRSFANKIGISDRSLRTYIKANEIPESLRDTINNALSDKYPVLGVRKAPECIYIVGHETECESGRHWNQKAFMTAEKAFAYIQKIIANEKPDIKWRYADREFSTITIVGNGIFEFTNYKDERVEKEGTMTIKYEKIMLDRD